MESWKRPTRKQRTFWIRRHLRMRTVFRFNAMIATFSLLRLTNKCGGSNEMAERLNTPHHTVRGPSVF